jgi:hypothetical protein
MLVLHVAMMLMHRQQPEPTEQVRRRKEEEEEIMSGYSPQDLRENWQFKIVRGTFKTADQVEAVVHEQAEFGWLLVEIFDQNRIRFKRPAGEAANDSSREGNPYATTSKASGPGCAAGAVLLAVVGLVGWLLLA